jgi:glutamyl-tRNA reductase
METLKFYCLGVNHKTAPVEVRERYAFGADELQDTLLKLCSLPAVDECLILSTCNRTEVYFTSRKRSPFSEVLEFLLSEKGGTLKSVGSFFYRKEGREAVAHGFCVASSLDSMVVGEPQIVNQFKSAFQVARELGTTGTVLNRFCEMALKVSKRVRTQTGVSRSAVSVSFVAVELAKKIFGTLTGKRVAIVGAGEMAELALRHLVSNGASQVIVVNRTLERAQRLAEEFGGRAYTFSDLPAVLKQADIVISSTGAPGYVLTRREVLPAVEERRHRPMFLIDIAVPRDIDPSLAEVDSLYVYDIDDLQEVVKANMKERLREAETARHIVDSYVERFIRWMRELEVAPLIAELKQKAETIRREELKKRLKGLNLTPEQTAEVENITRIIINKLLHQPIVSVKRKAVESEPHHILQAFREFFGLGKD